MMTDTQSLRQLKDVEAWNQNVLTLTGNKKHKVQIGDLLSRKSKEGVYVVVLGVVVRVAKPLDGADGEFVYAPMILWEDDTVESDTYASQIAKMRSQYSEESTRPLQLSEDAILKAIYAATPWCAATRCSLRAPRVRGYTSYAAAVSWGYASVRWIERLSLMRHI